MAASWFPTQTADAIGARIRASFRTALSAFPMGVRTFLGQVSKAVENAIWGAQKSVEDLAKNIVPNEESEYGMLAELADTYGLPDGSGVEGSYGPLVPTEASGGQATLTGERGTVYPDGAIATAEDGSTQIELSGGPLTIAGTPPGSGSVAAQFVAVTPGSAGNLPAGTKCTWDAAPAGADPTFVLTGALTDGDDQESKPALLTRLTQRLQTPPRGGVAEDHRLWAQEEPTIVGVYVYPRRSGTGTTDVIITQGGHGRARVPTETQRANVQTNIEAARPVASEQVNVILPDMPDGRGHLVRIRVEPNGDQNAFDWDDTGASYQVDTYTPSPAPALLKLNLPQPASLKAAIDAYKANPTSAQIPRLQVLSTNANAINPQIGVVDYDESDPTKTVLTLETIPADWQAPTPGDTIYAGGPVVDIIAANIQDLVDSLGPSLVSGFGDPFTPWEDTLAINPLTTAAENSTDANGDKLIKKALTGGCTIDGVAADVQPDDSTTGGPEILYLSHVAITA